MFANPTLRAVGGFGATFVGFVPLAGFNAKSLGGSDDMTTDGRSIVVSVSMLKESTSRGSYAVLRDILLVLSTAPSYTAWLRGFEHFPSWSTQGNRETTKKSSISFIHSLD